MEIDTREIFYRIYNDVIFPKLVFNQDGYTLDITQLAMQALFDISFAAGINYYKLYEFSYEARNVMTSGLIKKRFIRQLTTDDYCIEDIPEIELFDILEQCFIEGLNTGLQSDYFSD